LSGDINELTQMSRYCHGGGKSPVRKNDIKSCLYVYCTIRAALVRDAQTQ
jgi:hypothetical protein